MVEFKSILFPVDLGGVSANLIETVVSLVHKFDAELHVIYVARAFEPYHGYPHNPMPLEIAEKEIAEGSTQSLQAFADEFLGNLKSVKINVTVGHTAREILDYIDKSGVDLVVMGTHGRKGLDKILFGSVAQRVVQSSPAPVLTVKPKGRDETEIDWFVANSSE
jgi:nucleotide-binding universal stress UspA family protein